jgi:acetylornithine deacetylase/succinyl-diaminopimelate desuccinylase-like protein
MYGNAAANPLQILCNALGSMRDDMGKVTLPGFYDGVHPLPADIRAQWQSLHFDATAFLGAVGLRLPAGEVDQSALEMIWARPSFEINGVWGGYTGAGFKTVIPAEAHAKVSFRLVGDQDPDAIREAFRTFVREDIRADCSVTFHSHGQSRAITMPTHAPEFERARAALSEEWGVETPFIGAGGSIPIVGDFKRKLGLDTLLIGFGLDDDRIHSPNEKYALKSFAKGARSWVRVLEALAR